MTVVTIYQYHPLTKNACNADFSVRTHNVNSKHFGVVGSLPLGSGLDGKVIEPMVLSQARSGRMQKPVLIISIVDEQPSGEPSDKLSQVKFANLIQYLTDMPNHYHV